MLFLILDLYCLFSFTIHQGQRVEVHLTWKRNKNPTPKQSEEMSPPSPCSHTWAPSRAAGVSSAALGTRSTHSQRSTGKVPRKDFPDAKIHYSPDLWQAPWESNLAFQMNGRSGKRGACPSGEVIKSLQRGAGAAEGSSNPGFQLETLLALPHRQHSVKKYPKKHLPKHQLASTHRQVDDYQMPMQTKVSPTLSVAPYGERTLQS